APPKSWFMRMRFAPDGKTMITSRYTENSGYKTSLWDLATGEQVFVEGNGFPYAISPDGKFAAVGLAKFELLNLSDNVSGSHADASSTWARDAFLSSSGERVVTD